jgi:hypothetical protein
VSGHGAVPRARMNSFSVSSSSAYSHVIEGIMKKGRMKQRQCPTEMIVFVPVDQTIRKVFLLLRKAHNHPVHPRSKPKQLEAEKLISAVDAAGKIGLTVSKLLKGKFICKPPSRFG